MYVNGVSTRRVTEITEKLCGLELSSTQVSRLSTVLDNEIESFRTRSLGQIPYLILDARYERVRHKGCVRDAAVLIAGRKRTPTKILHREGDFCLFQIATVRICIEMVNFVLSVSRRAHE